MMKRFETFILFVCCILVFGIHAHAGQRVLKLTIDQEGHIREGKLPEKRKFSKPSYIEVKIQASKKLVDLSKVCNRCKNNFEFVASSRDGKIEAKCSCCKNVIATYFFVVKMTEEARKISSFKTKSNYLFREGGTFEKILTPRTDYDRKVLIYTMELGRISSKYTLNILMYDNKGDKLTQSGSSSYKIFNETFYTYFRDYFGVHAGIFFPFKKSDSYGLAHSKTAPVQGVPGPYPKVTHGTVFQPKALVFLSISPGVESERIIFGNQFWKRLHLNIGTEISESVLKKIYLGLGFEIKHFSINLFVSHGKEDILDPDYEVDEEIVNPAITAVPLSKEPQWRLGMGLSFPLDLATSILGKLIGL